MKNKKRIVGSIVISVLLLLILSISFISNKNNVSNVSKIETVDDSVSEKTDLNKSNEDDSVNKEVEDKTVKDTEREEVVENKEKEEENSEVEVEKSNSNYDDTAISNDSNNNEEKNNKNDINKIESSTNKVENEKVVNSTPVVEESSETDPVEKYVTISISCNTILNNLDKVSEEKIAIIPQNGIILAETQVEIEEGDTVFDVLLKITRNQRIHMDFVESPGYNSAYIKGINNIYEFDAGDLSGWKYSVNGVYPNVGCSDYVLKEGDSIQWKYTCDLGRDL